MLSRHDWITPTLGGSPWLEKPPLYYWQAMIAYRIFGVGDWAARLPSVFDATAMILAIYFFLRRFRSGSELDSAVVLTSCAAVVGFARAASMDMPLAATFTIAMIFWLSFFENGNRKYLFGFYGFLGLSMLAKGPVAPFFAAMILLIFSAAQRSVEIIRRSLSAAGIGLFFLISLPWYILVQHKNPTFFHVFIVEHNLARFGSNVFHHPEPFWYYIPVTLLGWAPWTIFVVVALIFAIRQIRGKGPSPVTVFLLIWIAVIVIFFSLSQSKLPGYILPAIPPGILLLGEYTRERLSQKVNALIAALHGLLCAALICSAFIFRFTVLHIRLENSTIVALVGVGVVFAATITVLLVKFGRSMLRLVTVVPAIFTLALAIRLGASSLEQTLSARPVSEALAQLAPGNLPVAVVMVSRETEFGLQFYRNQAIPRYELRQAPDGEHLVVALQGFQKAFAKNVPGRKIVYLGNFSPQKLEFFYVSSK